MGLMLPGHNAGDDVDEGRREQEDGSRQSRLQPGETEVGGGQQEGGEEAHHQHLPPGARGTQGVAPQHHQQAGGHQQLEAGAEEDDDPGGQGGRQGLGCCAAINHSLSSQSQLIRQNTVRWTRPVSFTSCGITVSLYDINVTLSALL